MTHFAVLDLNEHLLLSDLRSMLSDSAQKEQFSTVRGNNWKHKVKYIKMLLGNKMLFVSLYKNLPYEWQNS